MKLRCIFLLMISLITSSAIVRGAATTKTSQTFMFTRPVYQNIGATTFLWRNAIGDERKDFGASVRIMAIGQKTMNDNNCVTKYFSLKCKPTLLIAGDNTPEAGSRDIRAEWLGLPSNLSGFITLKPKQHQAGVVLNFNQHLGFSNIEFLADSWLELMVPVVQVVNQIKIKQSMVTQNNTPVDPSVIAYAFNQPTFKFGAICQKPMKETGLPEIRFIFGTTVVNKDDFLVNYYTGVVIPTGPRQDPRNLFSPVTGPNGHWGIVAGLNFELPLQPEDSCCKFKLFACMENVYLFHRNEMRVFDLRGKQWSRFMQFRQKGSAATVPGVNILSQPVRVHPHSFFNLCTGFNFGFGNFKGEVGYTLWTHPRECLSFCNPNCEGTKPAICSYGIAGTGTSSACHSTINSLAANDKEFKRLTRNHLNPRSGEARGAFTQAAHVAFGYYCNAHFVGIGGNWEQPTSNTAFEQWTIFFTAGTSF